VSAVLDGVTDNHKESCLKFDDGTDLAKTLGLSWDPVSDQLLFSFSVLQSASSPCRRSVLSAIARFYADWQTPIIATKPTLEVRRRILLIKSLYEDIMASSKMDNSLAALQRIFGYVYKLSNRIRRPTLTVSDL